MLNAVAAAGNAAVADAIATATEADVSNVASVSDVVAVAIVSVAASAVDRGDTFPAANSIFAVEATAQVVEVADVVA